MMHKDDHQALTHNLWSFKHVAKMSSVAILNTTAIAIPIKSVICKAISDEDTDTLEPSLIVGILPQGLYESDLPFYITLSDEANRVKFKLQTFMSKQYRVKGGYVVFGSVRLRLNEISATISLKIEMMTATDVIVEGMD